MLESRKQFVFSSTVCKTVCELVCLLQFNMLESRKGRTLKLLFIAPDLQEQKPIIASAGMTLADLRRLLLERRGRVRSVPEDHNAATHLLRHALGDDGYGGVATSRLSKMLSLPPEVARRYRDDITITVIHLNEPHL